MKIDVKLLIKSWIVDPGLYIILGVFLLLCAGVVIIILGDKHLANSLSSYSYFLFIFGIVIEIFKYVR